nr:hypothetical protein [Tanacetum cinerariifolium]
MTQLFCFASYVFCLIVGYEAHLRSLPEFEDHYNARHTDVVMSTLHENSSNRSINQQCQKPTRLHQSKHQPAVQKTNQACELIIEWFRTQKIVAKGQAYPSRDVILHGLPIEPGFVKVQVNTVEERCLAFHVARPTDEVKTLHEALGGQFIQWP